MKISKSSVEYNGKEYPTIDVCLSESEKNRNNGIANLRFADRELWQDICKFGEPESDVYPDNTVDYYMDNQFCAKYGKDRYTEGEAKVKVARVILSW